VQGAARGTQWTTGAAMVEAMSPLTNTLAGLTLGFNFYTDLVRFGQAINGGNQDEMTQTAAKLIFSVMGALAFTAYATAMGTAGIIALLPAAGLGYLAGGVVAAVLIHMLKDPIVLDLDGDGVALSPLNGSDVHFDFAGDGFAEKTGWVSASDGILAIDDNANGVIDNGLELFGSSTQDGFAVLEKLDANGDGKIDAQDVDFSKLKVWQDANQNGVSDAGELKTLSELGIVSISLNRESVNGTNQGHGVGYEVVFTKADGTTSFAQTIYFQTDQRQSLSDNTPNFTPAADVTGLPQLAGSGLIHSIAYKATNDIDFRNAWAALTDNAADMSPAELDAAFQALLLRWAGVDQVDSASRGPFVNAQHLAFVEKFFGETYREIQRNEELRTYPSTPAFGQEVEKAFQQISSALETIFLSQVALSVLARGGGAEAFTSNPYFFYSLLDLSDHGANDPQPDTPANIGAVVDLLVAFAPSEEGAALSYLSKVLSGLAGTAYLAFDGDRVAYAEAVIPHLAVIGDDVIRTITTKIVDGTAITGTISAEGLNGTSANDVFIGGGGGDLENGGAGSDIYVYAKHDGNLWIKDQGEGVADSDKLVLTDLNASNVTLDRIGNDLLIRVTETGKTIAVEEICLQRWGVLDTNHRRSLSLRGAGFL
jgi:hypothetical protein